jgi:hypothetical protein
MNCMYTAQGDYVCMKSDSQKPIDKPLLEKFIDSQPNQIQSCSSQITSCKPLCSMIDQGTSDSLPDDVKSRLDKCKGICKAI